MQARRLLLRLFLPAASVAGFVWLLALFQPRPPDLWLITVDTLRADRLGSYGYPAARTPVLDALAARGVRFVEASTPLPRTTPGLASLLTGLSPFHHGSREVGQPIGDVPLLAEILHRRGYATVAVVGNGTAGEKQHFDRGFDRFLAGFPRPAQGGAAGAVTDYALRYVDQVPGQSPLFLWVHYLDPHFPYNPPDSWTDQPAAPTCRKLADIPVTERGYLQVDRDGIASGALEACQALYDAEIAYTDAEIGRLLAGLEARGRSAHKAWVVFTADHGENLGEWGLYYEHGPNVHDASLRVPLLVAGPKLAPSVDRSLAELTDVMPTLLTLLKVPPTMRPPMDGVDLTPRLGGSATPRGRRRVTFAESGSALHAGMFPYLSSGRVDELACTNGPRFSLCATAGGMESLYDHTVDPDLTTDVAAEHPAEMARLRAVRRRWPPEQARQRAVRDGRFQLVETPAPAGGYTRALYDLEADRAEKEDVQGRYADLTDRLQRLLHSWGATGADTADTGRTQEALEALRSLGYVD